jgi:hypothetical protein
VRDRIESRVHLALVKKAKKASEKIEGLSADEDVELPKTGGAKTSRGNNKTDSTTKQLAESVKNSVKDQLQKAVKEEFYKMKDNSR